VYWQRSAEKPIGFVRVRLVQCLETAPMGACSPRDTLKLLSLADPDSADWSSKERRTKISQAVIFIKMATFASNCEVFLRGSLAALW
jgi:hypothetical protein